MSRGEQDDQQTPDVLELDHLIGFNGRNQSTCVFHPQEKSKIIYAVGGLVVIENVNEKHDQQLLRGHDMNVSALAVSASGNYVASGQIGSKFTKTKEAPIILWDYKKQKAIQVFKGMREGVTNLSFSHDDKFLAATGLNNTLTIWNCQDFSVVHNKWGAPRKSANKYNSYILISAQGSNLMINTLDFNVASMQYSLKGSQCQLPSSGLVRTYTCAIVDENSNHIFVGTTAGEVCIYSIQNQIFKAAIPISNNGVLSLALFNDILFVGSGDGRLKKLRGLETKWSLESEVQLNGPITSISPLKDYTELVVGTASNNIYRVRTQTVDSVLHTEGHTTSVEGIAFPVGKSDFFATIDQSGLTNIWDNNDLNIITKCTPGSMNKSQGVCVSIAEDDSIVCGYTDGFIRAYQMTNKLFSPMKWEIANAHKGSVTSVFANSNYLLSGGQDGIVRVWSRVNRQLITQISMHTKDVVSVFPDINKPNIIHSASIDKSVNSFDLKTDKKVIFHQAKNGMILDMSQRKDHEQELVTCGLNIPIQQWDCDVQDPVDSINYPERLNSVEISPSGKYMALGSDSGEVNQLKENNVLIFEVPNKKFQGKYLGHSSSISKLKWTPDEKQIVSVSQDSTICIWNFFP